MPESGQREEGVLSRAFMAHDLHIDDSRHVPGNSSAKPLPLLYSIIQIMKDLPRTFTEPTEHTGSGSVQDNIKPLASSHAVFREKNGRKDCSDDHFPVQPLQFKQS